MLNTTAGSVCLPGCLGAWLPGYQRFYAIVTNSARRCEMNESPLKNRQILLGLIKFHPHSMELRAFQCMVPLCHSCAHQAAAVYVRSSYTCESECPRLYSTKNADDFFWSHQFPPAYHRVTSVPVHDATKTQLLPPRL